MNHEFDDPDDQTFTLIVKADSDEEALDALKTSTRFSARSVSVRAVPRSRERVLTVDFDLGESHQWIDEIGQFRTPVINELNLWISRDMHALVDGVGYPNGSLLHWRHGGPLDTPKGGAYE